MALIDIANEPLICCELMCEKFAEWQIWWGTSPDDNTLACAAHVGQMLNPDTENRVYQYRLNQFVEGETR